MQKHALGIRSLSIAITLFGASHLFLNIYVTVLPSVLNAGEIQMLMRELTQAFGPIAIQQDRNVAILCVKICASALFLTSGLGLIWLREWSRRLLFSLLALRIMYGAVVCVIKGAFHPHLAVIIFTGLLLFYYLSRLPVKAQFT